MMLRNRWPLDLLLVAIVVLCARLAWVLTNTTTGWTTHLGEFADVAMGVVGVKTSRLSDEPPETQARFWLSQVSRNKSGDEDSQIAMGAAWMLDSPQFGFTKRHIRTLKKLDVADTSVGWLPEIDTQAIRTLSEEFESICRKECLSRIETATQLNSENVDLWRARALMSFKWTYGTIESRPRRDDWLSVLSECASHDLDNALYDYLAALHLWSSSAEICSDERGYFLKAEDPATFEQGTASLVAGQAKRHLTFVKNGRSATITYLNTSSVDPLVRLAAAESREINSRATNLLYAIAKWQSALVDAEKRSQKFDVAMDGVRKVLRISDQIVDVSDDPALRSAILILRRWGLTNLKELNDVHSNLLDAEDAKKVSVELDHTRLDLQIHEEAVSRWAVKTRNSDPKEHAGMAHLTMLVAQQFVVSSLGVALLSGFAGLVFRAANDVEQVGTGWMTHLLGWLVGIGGSFLLLGMSPAEIISPHHQAQLLCLSIWVGFFLVVLWVIDFIHKWSLLPWVELRTLIMITALPIAVLFHFSATVHLCLGALVNFHPAVSTLCLFACAGICWQSIRLVVAFARDEALSWKWKTRIWSHVLALCLIAVFGGSALATFMSNQFEEKVWISPTLSNGASSLHLTPHEFRDAMSLKDRKWTWAFIQWECHYGVLAGTLIAAGVIFIWFLIQQSRHVQEGNREIRRYENRRRLHQSCHIVARSCIVTLLVFSFAYLVTAPTVAESDDQYHKLHYQWLVSPSQTLAEIEAITTQLKSDEELLERLRAEIAERQRRIAEQSPRHGK